MSAIVCPVCVGTGKVRFMNTKHYRFCEHCQGDGIVDTIDMFDNEIDASRDLGLRPTHTWDGFNLFNVSYLDEIGAGE